MEQQIRFCSSFDGTRIAYATAGSGPPLVMLTNWLSHLEFDWDSPVWRHWLTEFSRNHTLIRYDRRGCGLSDWEVQDFSIEILVKDLARVVDALELEAFPVVGICSGSPVAIAYAVRYPERVTRLILHGSFGVKHYSRYSEEEIEKFQTMLRLMKVGWGQDNPAFRQFFTTLFMPDATPEQMDWYNELQRISTSPEVAFRILKQISDTDTRSILSEVRTPTLVTHSRGDAIVSLDEACELATRIPDARFVPLESKNHLLLKDEPAWQRFLAEVRAFLGTGISESGPGSPQDVFPELTPREREVLQLIALGLDNGEIADRLFISSKTIRNHITHIFDKLQVDHRAQAIVLAREAGLGREQQDVR